MGRNTSRKTLIGKTLMPIFDCISRKEISKIENYILGKACFSIDFLVYEDFFYKMKACVLFENKVDAKIFRAKIEKMIFMKI